MTAKPKHPSAAQGNAFSLRSLALFATAFAAVCLSASSAFASKQVVSYFGADDGNSQTTLGGELREPRDIAVNSSGAGGVPAGTIYVADSRNNRIQRFDKDGNFVSAWGADVVKSGGTGDVGDAAAADFEICTVASQCQAGVPGGLATDTKAANGALSAPQSVAVDEDTGNLYVSDRGNNRVDEYSAAGAFIRSFGWDVVRAGEPGDVTGAHEKQTIALDPGLDGSFTLSFGNGPGTTTTPIAVDASAGEVQSALQALSSIGPGNVAVSGPDGGPWTVEFTGALADRNVATLTTSVLGLSSPVGTVLTCASSTAAENTAFQWLTNGSPSSGPGATADTYTTVAADAGKPVQCRVTKTNSNGGSAQVSTPAVLVNPYPATAPPLPPMQASLGVYEPGAGRTERCSEGGKWPGNPTFTYRWYRNGVLIPGASELVYTIQPADVPGVIQCEVTGANAGGTTVIFSDQETTAGGIGSPEAPGGYRSSPNVTVSGGPKASVTTDVEGAPGGSEVCQGASAVCVAGNAGAGAGQIGSTTTGGALGIAVSQPDGNASTGSVYLADSKNQRVDTYKLDGTSTGSFGSSAQFGETQPRKVAVDSAGIVYASNSGANGELERYDTAGAAFLEPIAAGTPAQNERQTVHFDNAFATGDTFTLGSLPGSCSASTTGPIAWSSDYATAQANIQAALEAKCGARNFALAEGPFNPEVTFRGAFAETNVPEMTCATVSGAGACSITAVTDGVPAGPGALIGGETAGLEVSSAGALYVLRDPPSIAAAVQELDSPGGAAAPTAADDEHGSQAGFATVSGLGLDDSSGRLLVSSEATVSGITGAHVYVLGDSDAPVATLDPVTDHDARSATFSGTVDPGGALTGYRFEYVDDATYQADVADLGAGHGFDDAARFPLTDRTLTGTDPVAVSQRTPSHLIPGATYHVRLVARHVFDPSAEAIGGPLTFTTDGSPPSIDADATDVGTDAATLRAAIDPENQAVSDYHFQWGASQSYGNTTPSGNLPSGSTPVAVAEPLNGLTPGATYHYRLLATNPTGTAAGPDQTFTTPAGPPQFPGRGYEIASWYPTGGVPYIPTTGYDTPSADGNAIAVMSPFPPPGAKEAPFGDQQRGAGSGHATHAAPQYVMRRGLDGWQLHDVGFAVEGWSGDLERAFTMTFSGALGSGNSFEDPRVSPDDWNGYEDLYQRQPDGSLTWVSRDPRIPAGTPQTTPGGASLPAFPSSSSMSADGRTVVLAMSRQLADADTTSGEATRLYKWEDGTLSFIGIRPDGSVPADGSKLGNGCACVSTRYAVSRDGDRVVFSAARVDGVGGLGSSGNKPFNQGYGIYIQRDGEPTVEATRETGVAKLPVPQPYDVSYRGAAADDSRVFFTSASRFTLDSGAAYASESNHQDDLYLYDLAANKVRDLTPRLDGLEDPSVDPAKADRARVLGVAANSEDGHTVYFVAEGAYATAPNPEGELPAEGKPNLYMAKLGADIEGTIELRFIATLGRGEKEEGVWQAGWSTGEGKSALASPDGGTLGFASTQDLVSGQVTGDTTQLYAYDAAADRLQCASCPTDGSLPAEEVNRFDLGDQHGADWQGELTVRNWVSRKGDVFFTTASALLAADQNNVRDVYDYRDGALHLITTGTGTTQARLVNASVDGSTVFFQSLEALAPQDKEPGVPKLYAARVGGGFPYTPPQPGCDFSAGACEGRGTSAPNQPGAGSAAFEGPGDPKPSFKEGCPKGKREVRRKGKARCVKPRGHKHRHRAAKHRRRAAQ